MLQTLQPGRSDRLFAMDRAVILATDLLRGLDPRARDVPAPLLPVGGRPVIVHVIDALLGVQIRDLAIITGYGDDTIAQELGNGGVAGMSIAYFDADDGSGVSALFAVREFAGDEPFLLSRADVVTAPETYARVMRASRLTGASVAVAPADGRTPGVVKVTGETPGDGMLEAVDPVATAATGDDAWVTAGVGVLPPAAWPLMELVGNSAPGDDTLVTVASALLDAGAPVRAVPVEGPWVLVDSREGLEQARAAFEGRR